MSQLYSLDHSVLSGSSTKSYILQEIFPELLSLLGLLSFRVTSARPVWCPLCRLFLLPHSLLQVVSPIWGDICTLSYPSDTATATVLKSLCVSVGFAAYQSELSGTVGRTLLNVFFCVSMEQLLFRFDFKD